MRPAPLAFLLTLGLGAALMLRFPYRAVTPGLLRPGHRAQKENCLSCHTPFSGAPEAKCQACHRPGDLGLRTTKGVSLAQPSPRSQLIHRAVAGACADCHAEHGGRLAAWKERRRFPHDRLPASAREGCAACHAARRPSDTLHAAGLTECSRCHGTTAWRPAIYDHDQLFRFDRNHPPRCADCHPKGADLRRYSCTGCHEHAPDRMASKHREEGIVQNLEACRRCHPSGNEHDTLEPGGGEGRGRGEEDD